MILGSVKQNQVETAVFDAIVVRSIFYFFCMPLSVRMIFPPRYILVCVIQIGPFFLPVDIEHTY